MTKTPAAGENSRSNFSSIAAISEYTRCDAIFTGVGWQPAQFRPPAEVPTACAVSDLGLPPWTRPFVQKRDQPFGKGLVFDQPKIALGKAARKQRDPCTKQNRNHTQVKPVDQIRSEKGTGQL